MADEIPNGAINTRSMMEQTIGDVSGSLTKNITVVDSSTTTTGATHSGDVAATIDFIERIYNYLPELAFATIYGLAVYAAVRWINTKIK